jgi:hypothetical protein
MAEQVNCRCEKQQCNVPRAFSGHPLCYVFLIFKSKHGGVASSNESHSSECVVVETSDDASDASATRRHGVTSCSSFVVAQVAVYVTSNPKSLEPNSDCALNRKPKETSKSNHVGTAL